MYAVQESIENACDNNDADHLVEIFQNFLEIDGGLADSYDLIHVAVIYGSVDCLRLILTHEDVDPFALDNRGDSALFLALRRNSPRELIECLIEHHPQYLNMRNGLDIYPIHEILSYPNCMEIMDIFYETSKRLNIRLVDHTTYDGASTTFLAARLNKNDLVKHLIENVSFDVMHRSYDGRNLLQYVLDKSFCRLLDNDFLNYLFRKIYGREKGLQTELVPSMIKMSPLYSDWAIEKFYLDDENEMKSLVAELLEVKIIQKKDLHSIIAYLHSFIRDNPSFLHPYGIHCYKGLFDLFDSNPRLFDAVSVYFRNFVCDPVIVMERLSNYAFNFLNYGQFNLTKIIEFLDKVDAQKFNLINIFDLKSENCNFYHKLEFLMPFIAIPSADGIVDDYVAYSGKSNDYDGNVEIVEEICGRSHQRQPMLLQQMCRVRIRKSIFETNHRASNDAKLKIIKRMPLPVDIKNYLLFNSSQYDLTRK